MVRVSDSGPRGPGFDTRESQTLYRIFDGCHDYSTHDMSNLNGDCKKSDGRMQNNKLKKDVKINKGLAPRSNG